MFIPYIGLAQNHDQQVKVFINGDLKVYDHDQPPVFIDGRTLVPLRDILETLEARVNWDGSIKTVTVLKENKHVIFQIGSSIAYINGQKDELDTPAQILNGRTMVPLRFVSETLGANIQWDGATHSIHVYTQKEEQEVKQVIKEEVDITQVYFDVPTIMQKPELPNGCEITSLTAVLHYYKFNVEKTIMSDIYLPKEPFTFKSEKRYGPNPYVAYAGDPRSDSAGWFSYAPPIVFAAKNYLDEQDNENKPIDISGSTKEEIIDYLNKGNPVVIWVTLTLERPIYKPYWYLNDTGELFNAPTNLHCVVLNGYEADIAHVMDPLKGQVTYE
jgi:uncharacterized protein YvpB